MLSANVNLATEKATVEYDPARAGAGALIRAVEDAGYGVEKRESSFGVTGMSCASCAASVEKALRSVPGVVDASVNLAAESVTVEYLAGTAAGRDLQRSIEGAGYGVVREEEGLTEDVRALEYGRLRRRFFVAAALTALVVAGSLPMMLGLEVPGRWLNFVLLGLATPVQFWAGWRFYAGAWGALRHGRANMNTLVAVGTSTAYLYSAAATLAPWLFGGMADVYFDTSALIITLVLLGRLLEERARGRTRRYRYARGKERRAGNVRARIYHREGRERGREDRRAPGRPRTVLEGLGGEEIDRSQLRADRVGATIFPTLLSGRLATIVLVVALFVCHGAYGFEHQLGTGPGAVHSTQSGPMSAHHTSPEESDTGHGAAPHGGYFAVLIPLLLAAVLWLWRGSFRIPVAREAQWFTTRTVTPLMPHPPRGPTLYLFQVMRL